MYERENTEKLELWRRLRGGKKNPRPLHQQKGRE
jgi:hypothetical protein